MKANAPARRFLGNRVLMKILLAEDDNDMRRFLVKALQNAGFDVASFDNGLSAYNRLREEPFELLLTDIVMPEMDGIELARRATELDPDIKVMFITGFSESVLAMKAALVGCEAVTVAVLLGLLRRLGKPVGCVVAYAWHPLP